MKTLSAPAAPAKKKVARAAAKQPAPVAPVEVPAPLSTTLSLQASALVRWYGSVTRHREGDTVEGAVYGVLSRAKAAYEGPQGMDDGFDWLMEDVLAGLNDDERQPLCHRYGGGVTIQLSIEASELLHRALEAREDPRDVVSGVVESMLGSALDGTEPTYQEAIQAARERRLAREQEHHAKLASLRAYAATDHAKPTRKEAA